MLIIQHADGGSWVVVGFLNAPVIHTHAVGLDGHIIAALAGQFPQTTV